MTVPAWPATLPQDFDRQGFVLAEGDGRLKSPTDTGPGKMRRRSTAVADPMQGQMTMRLAQVLTLRGFVANDTAGGSLPFSIPDPFGGDPLLVQFADQGLPQYQNLSGDLWTATFKLDVLP